MENNGIKSMVEEDLKEIKKRKLDILILQRQNEELCQKNNEEIARLTTIIEDRLFQAEDNLKKSGERKIDTSEGWIAFREMPDKWEYDDAVIIAQCKKEGWLYYKTIEEVRKAELKKDIQSGILKDGEVLGIKVTPQEPKFNYKLNGGVL